MDYAELSRQADEYGIFRFVLTGGEAVLDKNLGELIEALDPMKHLLILDTNGWFFDEERRDEEDRFLEEPESPFYCALAFVSGKDLLICQFLFQDAGPDHKTGLSLLSHFDLVRVRHDAGLDFPTDRFDGRIFCGSPLFGILHILCQFRVIDLVICQFFHNVVQGFLCGLF